jgi:hypothetical protein
VGDRIEGRGWGTSNEHMEINSKNPQENIVDVQLENNQRTNGYFKGNKHMTMEDNKEFKSGE